MREAAGKETEAWGSSKPGQADLAPVVDPACHELYVLKAWATAWWGDECLLFCILPIVPSGFLWWEVDRGRKGVGKAMLSKEVSACLSVRVASLLEA